MPIFGVFSSVLARANEAISGRAPQPLALKSTLVSPIVASMKRIAIFVFGLALSLGPGMRAQDAATEERLNKLAGQIEDLRSNQEALTKKIDAIARDVETVRAQSEKPSGNFASDEDLKRLADAVKEIDRKRLEDYEKIRLELKNLGKSLAGPAPRVKTPQSNNTEISTTGDKATEKTNSTDKVFEYQVKKGDTLSLIVQAYRDNNIKITMDQVLKANPGLKPEKMRVGQKIFIPAPTS